MTISQKIVSGALKIIIDVESGESFLSKVTGSALKLSSFFQGSIIPLEIYPVTRIANAVGATPFADVSVTGLNCRVYLIEATGETTLASQVTFTAQAGPVPANGNAENYFEGNLDLNTTEMNTHIDTTLSLAIGAKSGDTYFVVQYDIAGGWRTILQTKLGVIKSAVAPVGAISMPTPAAAYYTIQQLENLFASLSSNPAGVGLPLTSPDGTKSGQYVLGDNGNPQFILDS